MRKEAAAWMAGLGYTCLALSRYGKKHFPVEAAIMGSDKLDQGRVLVFLSDLHDNKFGQDNCQLVEAIHDVEPDAVLCGDNMMVHKEAGDMGVPIKLTSQLANRYPVYYEDDNHENRIAQEQDIYGTLYEGHKSTLRRMGVVCLENRTAALGTDVLVSGIDLDKRCYREALYQKMPSMGKEYLDRKLGRTDYVGGKDRFRILLAHPPLYFTGYATWGAGLTLAGHLYGETVRIPTLEGVMAPQYQFFPSWCAGDSEQQGKRMVVSRGLGTHFINIWLNNRLQLVMVYLKKQRK